MLPARAAAYSETGTVDHIADGDTIDVDIAGDGTGTPVRIRMAGIQAMEVNDPGTSDDDCHATEAQTRLEELAPVGSTVTVTAVDAASSSRGRPLRFISRAGVGDVGLKLIQEGHAFAFPHPIEVTNNTAYIEATNEAADAGDNLWNPSYCGSGPSANVKFWAQWNADGDDNANINGEYMRITNLGASSLSLNGWQVRDSALNRYDFSASASIAAGATLTLYVGSGTNTTTKKYWGLSAPIFDNTVGDGAYLLDPHGDIRAHFSYPCLSATACVDPLEDKLQLSTNFDAAGDDAKNPNGEWVNINNVSGSTVNLSGYLLVSLPDVYEFKSSTSIASGARLRVYVGKGTDTSTRKYWGKSAGIFNNASDRVTVETFDVIDVAEFDWLCPSCLTSADVRIYSVRADASGNDATNPNGEYIKIKNYGASSVNLRDWQVANAPYQFNFTASRMLAPGEILTIYIGKGTSSRLTMYWGKSAGILDNGGDIVKLFNPFRAIETGGCKAWGSKSC